MMPNETMYLYTEYYDKHGENTECRWRMVGPTRNNELEAQTDVEILEDFPKREEQYFQLHKKYALSQRALQSVYDWVDNAYIVDLETAMVLYQEYKTARELYETSLL